MPVMIVSPNTQFCPKAFFFHSVLGTNPFFSLLNKSLKTFFPKPNFLAVSLNLSTPNLLATS